MMVTTSSLEILNFVVFNYVVLLLNEIKKIVFIFPKIVHLKGLSHEIDFKNVDENGQILALLKAAAGFLNFSEAPLIFS